ncbi:MAG: hypothetical protein ACPL0B_01750 [Anaerolineales bacterium]
MNNRNSKLPIISIILIWTIFVLIGYYRSHKPFISDQIITISLALFQTIIAGIFIILTTGLGRKIYAILFPSNNPSITRQFGLGLGIFSLLYLIISASIGIRLWISLLILIILFFLVYGESKQTLEDLWKTLTQFHPISRWEWIIFSLILFDFFLTWITAAAPPIKYDALLYHLELPKWYLWFGKFSFIAQNDRWGMPQTAEILYTFLMSIAGESAATILGWLFAILALIASVEIVPFWKASRLKWLVIIIPLTGFSFLDSFSWGYVDWLTFFWGALALQSLISLINKYDKSKIIELGIYCGFALGTKYTAGVLSIATAMAIFWLWFKGVLHNTKALDKISLNFTHRDIKHLLFMEFTIGFTILLVTLPWWIKNILATGQPFYPLLFPAGPMTPLRLEFYTIQPLWGKSWMSFLLPWTVTVLGVEGKAGYSVSIGPLFLLLSPFAWLGYRSQSNKKQAQIQIMTLIAVLLWLIWGLGSRFSGLMIQTRFYWSLFPALIVLGVFGYENISKLGKKPLNIIFILDGVILAVFALNSFQLLTQTITRGSPDYLLGITSREAYLENNLGWYAVAMAKIQELKPSKPVLLLFEPRGYYCVPYCDSDEILDEWYLRSYHDGMEFVNANNMIMDLKKQGYGYVLVFKDGVDFVKEDDKRYTNEQWNLLDAILDQLKLVENFSQSYLLYQLP